MEDYKSFDLFECEKYDELKITESTEQEIDRFRLLISSDLTQKHIWEDSGNHYDGLSENQREDFEWIHTNSDILLKEDTWYLIRNKEILYETEDFKDAIHIAINSLNLTIGDFLIVNKHFTLPL